ncbi:MAG: DUF4142 domain-containing protein [Chitinophagaceae bacterium]|nr:DUF4142 domain-containing protein [Chitinophagaceae bacterium]
MNRGKWLGFAIAILFLSVIGCTNKDDAADTRTNVTDSAFAILASSINIAEIAASQIVADSSSDSTMIEFAEMMLAEHSAAQQELQTVASQFGLAVTNAVDAEHQMFIDSLLDLKSPAIDSLYIFRQVADHEKAIHIFKNHEAHGRQRQLRFYTQELLPVLTTHLQQAQSLASQY